MKKLFLDFGGTYSKNKPEDFTIVLTNKYDADWVININKKTNSRNEIFHAFENYCSEILKKDKTDISIYKMDMFTSFFFPLGQWITVINDLISNSDLDKDSEIIFSTYANNAKGFIFEAEGETNSQFLYKKYYFLSYYLYNYFLNKGFTNIHFKKTNTYLAKFSYFLRGFIVLNVKTLQLLLYKLFLLKRNFNIKKEDINNHVVVISTRGIVQTQFIHGFYKREQGKILTIVNESSSNPFMNFKEAKKTFNSFFYTEGFLTMKQLIREYYDVIRNYYLKIELKAKFYGIEVDVNDLLPELGIKNFHIKTYAYSFNNGLKYLKRKYNFKIIKIISFEMLLPFSHYLKKENNETVVQIQSTLIQSVKYPNFIYSDQFYFNYNDFFIEHSKVNAQIKDKFNKLHNIKYFGIEKKKIENKFRIITYFTQPIYFDEEDNLIEFLKSFCSQNNMKLQIKLHPRAKTPKTCLASPDIKILNKKLSSQEVIMNTDIVITRNSSIGLDSWFMNVPILFFVNGTLKGENISYIPDDYLGNIKNKITVETLINNINNIITDFYDHKFHDNLYIEKDYILNEIFKIR